MSAAATVHVPDHLRLLAATAMLLERLERLPRNASAEQYRQVVRALTTMLDEAADDPWLPDVVSMFPAAIELHETLQHERGTVDDAALSLALPAEIAARAAIARARA